jgi:hypothetical protein
MSQSKPDTRMHTAERTKENEKENKVPVGVTRDPQQQEHHQ